jgi:hypothetical protein
MIGFRCVVLILLGMSYDGLSQSGDIKGVSDTLAYGRISVSRDLLQLRDSITLFLKLVVIKKDTGQLPVAERITQRLASEKSNLDALLEDVVNATRSTWDSSVKKKALTVLLQVRREFNRTKTLLVTSAGNN